MYKYVLKIDGMRCSMCECHVDDLIRKNFLSAKKVKSSHKKNESSFISSDDIILCSGSLPKRVRVTTSNFPFSPKIKHASMCFFLFRFLGIIMND